MTTVNDTSMTSSQSSDEMIETPKRRLKSPVGTNAPKKKKMLRLSLREKENANLPMLKQRLQLDETVNNGEKKLTIKSDERGLSISFGTDKWIRLSKGCFEKLQGVTSDIDACIKNHQENSWMINEEDNVYVSTKFFRNKMNVDIRKRLLLKGGNEVPTRCGVFLDIPAWNELKQNFGKHLCEDALKNTALGKMVLNVLAEYVVRLGEPFEEVTCQGCIHDWPSQKDHECLMNEDFQRQKETNFQKAFEKGKSMVDIHHFTLLLAQRGVTCSVEITRSPRYLMTRALNEWSDTLQDYVKDVLSQQQEEQSE